MKQELKEKIFKYFGEELKGIVVSDQRSQSEISFCEEIKQLSLTNSFDFNSYDQETKIRIIMSIYKDEGDEAYSQNSYHEAQKAYQCHLLIAKCVLHYSYNENLKEEVREVQNRLNKLDHIVSVPRPQLTPAIFPTIATSTPSLTTEERLKRLKEKLDRTDQLQRRLSENLDKYNELIKREKQRENISKKIIPLLENIIKDLEELKKLYTNDSLIELEVFQQVEETLKKFKKELSERRKTT